MSMQDPLADMLTRIRNAQMAKHNTVSIPSSNIKKGIAKVLMEEGYIESFSETGNSKKELIIVLKYFKGKPVLEMIKRESRSGLRKYIGVKNIPKVNAGLGTSIVSTSQGIMTDRTARKVGIGGELLCTVF